MFQVPLAIFMFCLESVYSGVSHFLIGLFFFVQNYISSVNILKLTPYQMHCWQICLPIHSVGSLFILLMDSLAVQKLLSVTQSHLFTFSFVSLAQENILVLAKNIATGDTCRDPPQI